MFRYQSEKMKIFEALTHSWAVPELIAVLKDPSNNELQKEAASVLGHTGDLRAVEPLIETLKISIRKDKSAGDSDPWVISPLGECALTSLVQLKNPASLKFALELLGHPSLKVNRIGLEILRQLELNQDRTTVEPVWDLMYKCLYTVPFYQSEVHKMAYALLIKLLPYSHYVLGDALKSDPDPYLYNLLKRTAFAPTGGNTSETQDEKTRRVAALDILVAASQFPKKMSIEPPVLLADKRRAIRALGKAGDPRQVTTLVNLLTDKDLRDDAEAALVLIGKAGEEAISAEMNRMTYRPMGWKSQVENAEQRIHVHLGNQRSVQKAINDQAHWNSKMVKAMTVYYLKYGQKSEVRQWLENVCLYAYGLYGNSDRLRVTLLRKPNQELGQAAFTALKLIRDDEWLNANIERLTDAGFIEPSNTQLAVDSQEDVLMPVPEGSEEDRGADRRTKIAKLRILTPADFDTVPGSLEGIIYLLRNEKTYREEMARSKTYSKIRALMTLIKQPEPRAVLVRYLSAQSPQSVPALLSAIKSQNLKVAQLAYETLRGLNGDVLGEEGQKTLREFEEFCHTLAKWQTILKSDDYAQLITVFNEVLSKDQLIEIAKLLTNSRSIRRMGQIMVRAHRGEYFHEWLSELPYEGYTESLLSCPDKKIQEKTEEIKQVQSVQKGIKMAHGMLARNNMSGALEVLQKEAAHPADLPVLLTMLFHNKVSLDFKVLVAEAIRHEYGTGAHGDVAESMFSMGERILFPISLPQMSGDAVVDINTLLIDDEETDCAL